MAPVSENTGLLEDIFSLVAQDLEVEIIDLNAKGQRRLVEVMPEDDLIPTTVLEKEAVAPVVSSIQVFLKVTI